MSLANQLYQLQEFDLEIEVDERALPQLTRQLEENEAVTRARTRLSEAQQQRDELKRQQRSVEWSIDDLVSKITAAEEQLYSGRIQNPKELLSLHQEVNLLKTKRDQLETNALEIMTQVDRAETDAASAESEFKKREAEWQLQREQLAREIEILKSKLASLKDNRQQLTSGLDPSALAIYEKLRKQKGQAVAKVEQGICRGCRISLPSSELQQARSGNLVHCGSCGRILFLP